VAHGGIPTAVNSRTQHDLAWCCGWHVPQLL
jgi:hypothetical protein